MAFSRKARTALRKSRQGKGSGYLAILLAGEAAFRQGLTLADNPYPVGSEDNEDWAEAFTELANDR